MCAGARYTPALLLGDDLCIRTFRQLCSLRRTGQHLLNLQVRMVLLGLYIRFKKVSIVQICNLLLFDP